MQTALYILVILTQSKKSRYCFGWVTKKTSFSCEIHVGVHLLRLPPEIQVDWETSILELNTTEWWKENLSCGIIRAAWRSLGVLIRPLVRTCALSKMQIYLSFQAILCSNFSHSWLCYTFVALFRSQYISFLCPFCFNNIEPLHLTF